MHVLTVNIWYYLNQAVNKIVLLQNSSVKHSSNIIDEMLYLYSMPKINHVTVHIRYHNKILLISVQNNYFYDLSSFVFLFNKIT